MNIRPRNNELREKIEACQSLSPAKTQLQSSLPLESLGMIRFLSELSDRKASRYQRGGVQVSEGFQVREDALLLLYCELQRKE